MKKWAKCQFMAGTNLKSADPEINGFLLMHEGHLDRAPVIKGVLRDDNDESADNFIKRRRFNQMKVFKNYSQTCDIGEMGPFYQAIEKPLKFKNDYYSIYFNDMSSFSLYGDKDIVNQGSIGIMDDD